MRVAKLGDVADVNWGDTSLTKASYVDEGYPAYSATGADGYLPYFHYDREAIVLSAIGARCGKTWFASGKWSAIKNTIRYWSENKELDNRYLYWITCDPAFWPKRGAAQPFITIGDARKLQIAFPSLAEQRRIAAILDQADELRRKRQSSLFLLDSLIPSIFSELLLETSSSCEQARLEELVAAGTIVTYGIVQAGDEYPGGVPYIRTGDIVDGEIRCSGLRHTDPSLAARFNRSRIQSGEIVMSIRATVGTTALVPAVLDGANLTQGTARIAPGPRIDKLFLLYFLRSSEAQLWISKQVKGATFREITLTRLRDLPVRFPPLAT
jgi:type I restriction enzyme S subunit